MSTSTATAVACPNIAFIKYWGNTDPKLKLPANGSISMNLAALETITSIYFMPHLKADRLIINSHPAESMAQERVSNFLDHVRRMAHHEIFAEIESQSNFPIGAGIASSASAFAALALASSSALGLALNEQELSSLARLGSGSACRSIPSGFVEWKIGDRHENSFAVSIASANHWDLVDCIAIVEKSHKSVSSTVGHALADTSPLQTARIKNAEERLNICRMAILNRDFSAFSKVVELDSNMMHAVMMTSTPPILYWAPASVQIMKKIMEWRAEGLQVCYTLDAGPNVHAICISRDAEEVKNRLSKISAVENIIMSRPGKHAHLLQA
ncbi:MAG: diphosphomevalonate decarboxylase [Anaerolineaceae bacterium]